MTLNNLRDVHLIELVKEIRRLRLYELDDYKPLSELEGLFPGIDVGNLCNSDYPAECVIELCRGWNETRRILSKQELTSLVKKILSGPQETEAQDMLLRETFDNNCFHPAKRTLILDPASYFDGNENPTAEEIVSLALRKV